MRLSKLHINLVSLLSIVPLLLAASPAGAVEATNERGSCGAESLWALAQKLGVQISKENVIAQLGKLGQLSSMLRLQEVAADFGISLKGQQISYNELCEQPRPVIVHLRWGHFLVVVKATEQETIMIDGYDRQVTASADTFRKQWSGYVLVPQSQIWILLAGLLLASVGVAGLILSFLFRSRNRIQTTEISST